MAATGAPCKSDARSRATWNLPRMGPRGPLFPARAGRRAGGSEVPGTLLMVYGKTGSSAEQPDDVEPVAVAVAAVPGNPGPCGRLEVASFAPGHGLQRVPVTRTPAGFYLDKRDQLGAPRNKVDLLVTPAPVPVQDGPAAVLQQLCRPPFRGPAEFVRTRHASILRGSRGDPMAAWDRGTWHASYMVREALIPEKAGMNEQKIGQMIDDRAGALTVLERARRVAVIGMKPETKSAAPAHYVPAYLKRVGYEVIPVPCYYPDVQQILGEKVYRTLAEIPGKVDLVVVFRRPEHIPPHVDDIIAKRPDAVWFQLGIRNDDAAQRLAAAGIDVVQDRCTMVDHRALRRAS